MQTRTNIVLDDNLVQRAMRKAAVRTKREAVEVALRAYVEDPDLAALLALRGSGGVAESYDPKACEPGTGA
jgi:Arc/MetJ family transcription regulator